MAKHGSRRKTRQIATKRDLKRHRDRPNGKHLELLSR